MIATLHIPLLLKELMEIWIVDSLTNLKIFHVYHFSVSNCALTLELRVEESQLLQLKESSLS